MAKKRRAALIGWLGTLAALVTITTRSSFDSIGLAHSGMNLNSVVGVYLILLIGLGGLVISDLPDRVWSKLARFRWIGLVTAVVVTFAVLWLMNPEQAERLKTMPFSLWVIIVHAIGMAIMVILHFRHSESNPAP